MDNSQINTSSYYIKEPVNEIMNQLPEPIIEPTASSEVETLGVKAVSKSLGVSRATVLRWIKAKKIDGFFRIDTKWLIRRSDFDEFIKNKVGKEADNQ